MSEIAIQGKMNGIERDEMGQNKIEKWRYWFWKYCWLPLINGKREFLIEPNEIEW